MLWELSLIAQHLKGEDEERREKCGRENIQ